MYLELSIVTSRNASYILDLLFHVIPTTSVVTINAFDDG
jgi:hypothetical protein